MELLLTRLREAPSTRHHPDFTNRPRILSARNPVRHQTQALQYRDLSTSTGVSAGANAPRNLCQNRAERLRIPHTQCGSSPSTCLQRGALGFVSRRRSASDKACEVLLRACRERFWAPHLYTRDEPIPSGTFVLLGILLQSPNPPAQPSIAISDNERSRQIQKNGRVRFTRPSQGGNAPRDQRMSITIE
ncbi:hypothetical protein ACVWW4_000014 [Bradyrhizobium sp. LB7.1]